jgi:hypothetical protein
MKWNGMLWLANGLFFFTANYYFALLSKCKVQFLRSSLCTPVDLLANSYRFHMLLL